jgi:hypothetical protein
MKKELAELQEDLSQAHKQVLKLLVKERMNSDLIIVIVYFFFYHVFRVHTINDVQIIRLQIISHFHLNTPFIIDHATDYLTHE